MHSRQIDKKSVFGKKKGFPTRNPSQNFFHDESWNLRWYSEDGGLFNDINDWRRWEVTVNIHEMQMINKNYKNNSQTTNFFFYRLSYLSSYVISQFKFVLQTFPALLKKLFYIQTQISLVMKRFPRESDWIIFMKWLWKMKFILSRDHR